jgi:hypothetical protein
VIARRLLAAALLPAVLVGCSSSSSGASVGKSVEPAALAGRLDTALTSLTSAHLDIDAGALGGKSTADVQLADGRSTATDVHLTQSGQQVEVVTVGDAGYAKIPAAANDSGKPWVAVEDNSHNAIAESLATTVSVADVTTSLSVVSGLVRSAADVREVGSDRAGGVAATRYTMKLNPQKGTGNSTLDGLLKTLGSTSIPVDLWLDGSDRPVKFTLHIALGGTALPVTVAISRFDAPLTITAPPSAEVSSR